MKTLRGLIPIAVLVLAALVGYTYWKTGKVGLWPEPAPRTQYDQRIKDLRAKHKEIDKELGDLKGRLAMSLPGASRSTAEERIAELEKQRARIEDQLLDLERFRKAELEQKQ